MKLIPDAQLSLAIGLELKALREERYSGESMRTVALQIGVDNSFLSTIEQGKRTPSIHTLNIMLYHYSTGWDEFFSRVVRNQKI